MPQYKVRPNTKFNVPDPDKPGCIKHAVGGDTVELTEEEASSDYAGLVDLVTEAVQAPAQTTVQAGGESGTDSDQ